MKEQQAIPSYWHWCGEKYHFIAMVQDCDIALVVHKHWIPVKQRWMYGTDTRDSIIYKMHIEKNLKLENL